jgi:hypothetical protein
LHLYLSHLHFYCNKYLSSQFLLQFIFAIFPKYYKSSRKRTFLHTFLQDGDYGLQLYDR